MNKIGVISALSIEGRCLFPRHAPVGESVHVGNQVYLRIGGIGHENASKAAADFINEEVNLLVSWGVAAALGNATKAGDLVLAEQILDISGQPYPVQPAALQALKYFSEQAGLTTQSGNITETTGVLATETSKSELHQQTGAIAADMESAAIASAASRAKIPFLAVRVISDDAHTPIPHAISKNMDTFGRMNIPGLFVSLCFQPAEIMSLVRLARGFKQARYTLARCSSFFKPLLK